ncbi:MAG: 2-oxoglutarate synthase [Firmicutes bacterium]|nr:2-oxoglutarate synthase [Bacillota bacterium]
MSELSMPRCYNRESKPHRFCPGCGHGLVLKALGMAIDELDISSRMVFACDIGCSLLAWNFFSVDSLQTHHGRTLPVVVGIKRARPELVTVAYMGDGGGYAIGLQHLVSTALRNDPVTVIVVNNTTYAMTGGQMAPTTLEGQHTKTSPGGRDIEETGAPFKGPESLIGVAPPESYLARGTVANVIRLKKMIRKGLERQLRGDFAFIEALSTCPTNWRTDAAGTWGFLEHEMGAYYQVGEMAAGREPITP